MKPDGTGRPVFLLRPIGVIRTPYRTAAGTPIQSTYGRSVEGEVIVEEAYEPALADLERLSLFPGHRGPAFRAFLLEARRAALVWFLLPTLRADTVAAGSQTAPHAAGPLAVQVLITAFSYSHPASYVHELFLLADATHFSGSTAAAAARHSENIPIKAARKPSLDDLAQIADHKGNDPDAVGSHRFVQSPGNRAANQSVDAQLREAKRFLDREVIRK